MYETQQAGQWDDLAPEERLALMNTADVVITLAREPDGNVAAQVHGLPSELAAPDLPDVLEAVAQHLRGAL